MRGIQTLRVVPIVEGHGEVDAVRILLQRLWSEFLGRTRIDVERPIRESRGRLVADDGVALANAALLARAKLGAPNLDPETPDAKLVLVIVDADKDCAATLGPALLARLRATVGDAASVACVVAVRRYETWLVGGADTMLDVFAEGTTPPNHPEEANAGKAWIAERLVDRPSYKETVDQPRLTARMDLGACRARCPSFDKLCRVLEAL